MATPAGCEPATTRLEGECSIQLSYGVITSVRTGNARYNGPAANAVVAKIIRIALRLLGALVRLDDRIVEPVVGRERDRLLHRLQTQLHLVKRDFGAGRP